MHDLNIYVDGKRVKASLTDEELTQVLDLINAPGQTGYERVDTRETFYYNNSYGDVCAEYESNYGSVNTLYDTANYYSSEEIAESNARADRLMRKLRRFAVENRGENWQVKSNWCIVYSDNHVGDYTSCRYHFREDLESKSVNTVYFDSKETAAAALHKFYEDISWYFTEYQNSL